VANDRLRRAAGGQRGRRFGQGGGQKSVREYFAEVTNGLIDLTRIQSKDRTP